MGISLREYQFDSIEAINRQWQRGCHSTIVNLSTGLGKTVVFIEYIKRHIDLTTQRALVMTPAHLIWQTRTQFMRFYPEFNERIVINGYNQVPKLGVELASQTEPRARIVVGSVPTLIDRVPEDFAPLTHDDISYNPYNGEIRLCVGSKRKCLVSPRVDDILKYGMINEVIYDEAHHSVAPGGLLLITRLYEIAHLLGLPTPRLIGFTATPYREDGLALGNLYQTIAIQRSWRWGVEHGYLAPLRTPIRVHAQIPTGKDQVLNVQNWTDIIIKAWREKGENRPTVAYLPSVESSRILAEEFRKVGVPAAHLDADETIDHEGKVGAVDDREGVFNAFLTGKCRLICNYSVIFEGIDIPPASCIIWARSTENSVLGTQALGRILRLFDGNDHLPPKTDSLIIDITGNNMNVLSAGTLAGFRVDPLTDQYVEEVFDEEEETLFDGRDYRDTVKGVVQSSGAIYSIGKLIKKSGSDWYWDETHDVLSLGISQTDALVIVPPCYTMSNHLEHVSTKLLDKVQNMPDNIEAQQDYEKVSAAQDLFGNYTLWHYIKGRGAQWINQDVSLDRLMDFAVPYMSEVSDPVGAFVKRGQNWKRQEMSATQKPLLRKLCAQFKMQFDEALTRGEASQLITHLIAFNGAVRVEIAKIYKGLGRYVRND